jgi:hypothetical protein
MQRSTEKADNPLSMENAREGSNLNTNNDSFAVRPRRKAAKHTNPWDPVEGERNLASPQPQAEVIPSFAVRPRRKAAKHANPWDLVEAELNLSSSSSSPLQAEVIPARKKARRQKPISASTDKAATKSSSPDTAVSSAVANPRKKKHGTDWVAVVGVVDDETKLQCYQRRYQHALDPRHNDRAMGKWQEDEDTKLKDAIQTYGSKNNWGAIAALVPGRAESQCYNRWRNTLNPDIDRGNERGIQWTKAEDKKLTVVVQKHNGKDFGAISALIPGRTRTQCYKRWHDVLGPRIDRATGNTGAWTADEDELLKDSVQTHEGKDWAAIAALVPGRSKKQCYNKWHQVLLPSSYQSNGLTGTWTEDEDIKLKDAVEKYGGKNWGAIAALVPDRTESQCYSRWHTYHAALTIERSGKWTEDEDSKLEDAVHRYGVKKCWDEIAAMVPGRVAGQCRYRWHHLFIPSINRANERTGTWAKDEDIRLKDAVQTHGGKNWGAVSALVGGRSVKQCWNRWHHVSDPDIDKTNARTKRWTAVEDSKLKDAIQTHGGKNWGAISALMPGRAEKQCLHRWHQVLIHMTELVDVPVNERKLKMES